MSDTHTYYAVGYVDTELLEWPDLKPWPKEVTDAYDGCVGAVLLFDTRDKAEEYAAKRGAKVIEVRI